MQREQAKAYEAKLKNEKAQRIRQRNEERAVQSQYKQEWDSIKAKAKQDELNADLAYLKRVENEIEQAKERDRMMLEQRRLRLKKTRIENERQKEIKMKILEKEKEEDQERMRQFEANELAKEKRRLADLEAMKKHQSVLMTIGNEAIEKQRENRSNHRENIERAIRLQDEKARLAQEASEAARKKMIHDTNVWREEEEASRQAQKKAEWDAEQERLRKMQNEFQRQEELEGKDKGKISLAKMQYKQDLMNQMREQEEAKRRSYIEMSPTKPRLTKLCLVSSEGMMKFTQKEETQ